MPPPEQTPPAANPAPPAPAGPQGGAQPMAPVTQPVQSSLTREDPFDDNPKPVTPAAPTPPPSTAQAPALQPGSTAPQQAPATPAAAPAAAPGQPAATPTTSGQPAVGAQPAQPATAAPAAPAPATDQDIIARLPKGNKLPPEQQAEFARGMTTWLNDPKNKDALQGANDLKAGKNTPQAQQFNAAMEQRQKEFTEERTRALAAADPKAAATPQGWAGMFSQASQQWEQMPQEMKLVMGLGLGGGLLGMASSMFGEGGMGMGILGLLGIGGGLAAGAAGGMFGQGAQKATSDMAYDVGSFFGAVPQAGSMEGKFNQLKSPDALKQLSAPTTAAEKLQAFRFPKEEQAKVRDQLAMTDKVKSFMRVPAPMRANWLQKMDPSLSPQEAAVVAQNLESMATQMDDAQSPLAQKIQTGRAFANAEDPATYVNQQATDMANNTAQQAKTIGSHVLSGLGSLMTKPKKEQPQQVKTFSDRNMNINKLIEKWAFNDVDAKELSDLKAEQAKGAPYRVEAARRENELQMRQKAEAPQKEVVIAACQKAARCWSGYEPVPGAKKFSKGSCRPKGSKKTQKEMKKS